MKVIYRNSKTFSTSSVRLARLTAKIPMQLDGPPAWCLFILKLLLHTRTVCFPNPRWPSVSANPRFSPLGGNITACGRLINRTFSLQELSSLAETILSREGDGGMTVDDAQTLVEVLDEASPTSPRYCVDGRRTDVKSLGWLDPAGTRSFPRNPETMPYIIVQDMWPTYTTSESRGGLRLRREHQHSTWQWWPRGCVERGIFGSGRCDKGYQDIPERRFGENHQCWVPNLCATATSADLSFCTEILQRGRDVEIPSTSKYPTVCRCIHVREPIRDGVGVDEKWNHQPVRQGAPRNKPA